MKEITALELKAKMDNQEDFQLIDVREPDEHQLTNIGGELIPMGIVLESIDKIAQDKPVIVYCRSGRRSANIILELEEKHEFDNLYNLKGGILAYADDVDSNIIKY